ncbi:MULTISPECIES: hypothetical protein [unclassified Marinobacterium]|uniref:hypothetical protein n=1 Tax=unclassified Marinobacterium TaxID=2644139 RepID=UPI001569D0F2|nr:MULTISPECIES: hypothetical protein [unclassified Marinobacterium]NRP10079.1 hypothetical protein [Marinobacterium sp. xm-g-48]NRP82924.1 hypothetical protein [Marinobacterium sp. xm-d-509]
MHQRNQNYSNSLRRFAEQWTDSQIREAIADEKRILADQSLSPLEFENSKLICEIYEEVLSERNPNTAA